MGPEIEGLCLQQYHYTCYQDDKSSQYIIHFIRYLPRLRAVIRCLTSQAGLTMAVYVLTRSEGAAH